jgi:hypothetical protein
MTKCCNRLYDRQNNRLYDRHYNRLYDRQYNMLYDRLYKAATLKSFCAGTKAQNTTQHPTQGAPQADM